MLLILYIFFFPTCHVGLVAMAICPHCYDSLFFIIFVALEIENRENLVWRSSLHPGLSVTFLKITLELCVIVKNPIGVMFGL